MKMLKILISAICMIFGNEEYAGNNHSPVFQETCEISTPFSVTEIDSNTYSIFQARKPFYTREEKAFAKEHTIMSFKKGHFYLAEGFWDSLKKEATEQKELIYIAQKD